MPLKAEESQICVKQLDSADPKIVAVVEKGLLLL